MNIRFSVIRNSEGPATKRYWLRDGRLEKQSCGNMVKGEVRTITVADLDGFLAVRDRLRSNEAFVYGTCEYREAALAVSNAAAVRRGEAVARTKLFFPWRDQPTIQAFDYDPGKGRPLLSWQELDAIYGECLPGFSQTKRAWTPSASAFIYRGDQELIGSGGWRCYIVADNGLAVPDVADHLYQELWKKGHGFIELSDAGRRLDRTLSDITFRQSERLDFAAKPILRDGLARRAPPVIILPGAPMLQTAGIKPEMSSEGLPPHQSANAEGQGGR